MIECLIVWIPVAQRREQAQRRWQRCRWRLQSRIERAGLRLAAGRVGFVLLAHRQVLVQEGRIRWPLWRWAPAAGCGRRGARSAGVRAGAAAQAVMLPVLVFPLRVGSCACHGCIDSAALCMMVRLPDAAHHPMTASLGKIDRHEFRLAPACRSSHLHIVHTHGRLLTSNL